MADRLPRRVRFLGTLLLAAGASACDLLTEPQFVPSAPATIDVSVSSSAAFANLPYGPVYVRVRDEHGRPVAGVSVAPTVSSGGSVRPITERTDSTGLQLLLWRLSPSTSSTQIIRVSAGGAVSPGLGVRPSLPPVADLVIANVRPMTGPGGDSTHRWIAYDVCYCDPARPVPSLWADVDVYLSIDPSLSADDALVTERREHILQAGHYRSLGLGIRRNVAAGWRYPIFVVNWGRNANIPEPTWSNNVAIAADPVWFSP